MKIKQTTKMIILVVALVSVIGVGAVSFALWQGGAESFTANASVGEIALFGWDEATWTGFGETKLIPNNQPGTSPDGCAKVLSAQLPVITTTNGTYTYTVTVKVTAVNVLAAASSFKVLVGDQVTEANMDEATGWETVQAKDATVTFEVGTSADATITKYFSIQLVSEATSDMNATIALKSSLGEAAVEA